MTDASSTRDPRSKQACEPCRKKKSKCTAEKPVCSFCRRLNQQCVYRAVDAQPADRRSKVKKASKTWVQSAAGNTFDPLAGALTVIKIQKVDAARPLPNPRVASQGHLPDPALFRPNAAGPRLKALHTVPQESESGFDHGGFDTPGDVQLPNYSPKPSFSLTNPDPPLEVISHLIDVYCSKIHLQPLPLFSLQDLQARLTSSPPFLLWSFIALTLSLTTHEFYSGKESDAIEYYGNLAEGIVKQLACQGSAGLEVVQSLCLLALRDVWACNPAQAWMTIGTASRLEAFRMLSRRDSPGACPDSDINARCYWSVYVLERIFTPQHSALTGDDEMLALLSSPPIPPALPSVRDDYPSDLCNPDRVVNDTGVNVNWIKMVSTWEQVSTFLHQVRLGNGENPWDPQSSYTKLNGKLFEHEATLHHEHLLRNVLFPKRSPQDISAQREYWIPWVLQQVISHAAPAIINHPFIHLVAMRQCPNRPQPQFFLQQTVDLALFHSGWVFRLLRLCESQQLQISDPILGHLVAAIATIPWLFQLASDSKVSQRAKDDLAWCKEFLGRLSKTWPHISQKLDVLQKLQFISDKTNDQTSGERGVSVSFKPVLFWTLLDPNIHQMKPWGSSQDGSASYGHGADVKIRITTHFIHPLTENEFQTRVADCADSSDSFWSSPEDFEQLDLDGLFSHFMSGNMQEPYF